MSIITLFNGYDDPNKAGRIFYEYYPDIPDEKKQIAQRLIRKCHTADDLDLALDGLSSGHKPVHFCGNHHKDPEDSILDCGYSNCLRSLEETRPLDI